MWFCADPSGRLSTCFQPGKKKLKKKRQIVSKWCVFSIKAAIQDVFEGMVEEKSHLKAGVSAGSTVLFMFSALGTQVSVFK